MARRGGGRTARLRGMRFGHAAVLAPALALAACRGPAEAHPPEPAAPSGSARPVAAPADTAPTDTARPTAPSAASSATATGEPATAPAMAVPAECRGSSFDLDALFATAGTLTLSVEADGKRALRPGGACSVPHALASLVPASGAAGLEVSLGLEPARVRPGGEVRLTVTFANRGAEPLTLGFRSCVGDPLLEVEGAFAADGTHADEVPSDYGCGVSKGCDPRMLVLRLAAGGSARATGRYRAERVKLGPPCAYAPVGPLASGSYSLRVMTPLVQGGGPAAARAEAVLEVGP
ncbi:MAG: hypothetical protein HY908_18960 [Myxococcales bacterium]|nr:hypothetical protein [Myxococcales bacterium]